MVNGIGNRGWGGDADDFAGALRAKRPAGGRRFHDVTFHFGRVLHARDGVARDTVAQDDALFHLEFFHQRMPQAHHNPAFHLSLEAQGVDNPASVIGREHFLHADRAAFQVQCDLHCLGGKTIREMDIATLFKRGGLRGLVARFKCCSLRCGIQQIVDLLPVHALLPCPDGLRGEAHRSRLHFKTE